ncbi:MAG TPA: hypothetical protein VMD55_04255 [Terracidiphilus sp.]|nr:hypothetical protein [Terracidiphilus sp.]
MRVEIPHLRLVSLAFVLCILISGAPVLGGQQASDVEPAQPGEAVPAHPALVFFSQHRLPGSAWTALFAAVRTSLPEAAAEVPSLDAHVELIRGDTLAHGTVVPQSVTVYLHGDCNPAPIAEPSLTGERLGWVMKVGPRIEPVIHVECTPIGQELSGSMEGMSRDERTAAMSEALARVILHEWAHIATQSSAHGKEGITKAQFGVNDLILRNDRAQICPQSGLR